MHNVLLPFYCDNGSFENLALLRIISTENDFHINRIRIGASLKRGKRRKRCFQFRSQSPLSLFQPTGPLHEEIVVLKTQHQIG